MKFGRILVRRLGKKKASAQRRELAFRPLKVRFSFQPESRQKKGQRKKKSRHVIRPHQGQKADLSPVPVSVESVRHPARVETARILAVRELVKPHDALAASIEAFLLDQRSEHTRRSYGKDLKRFMKFALYRQSQSLGEVPIDRHLIIAYKEMLLSEGLEHTSVDRHLATLRSFFRWMTEDGHIEKNPAEGVRFLSPKRLSQTVGFSDKEVLRVLAQPDLHTRTGALHYAVLMVLFYCGLRRSELCELRTLQLGEERGHAVIRLTGKGNRERVIPLLPQVKHAIELYLRMTYRKLEGQDEPLFMPIRNNRGDGKVDKPLDPSMIFYIVRKYSRQAGIASRVSPHSCRATAISNARDHQVPDRAIQEFAGWSSTSMITHYDKRKTAVEGSAALVIEYDTDPPAV